MKILTNGLNNLKRNKMKPSDVKSRQLDIKVSPNEIERFGGVDNIKKLLRAVIRDVSVETNVKMEYVKRYEIQKENQKWYNLKNK
jgi:hypothetical protein